MTIHGVKAKSPAEGRVAAAARRMATLVSSSSMFGTTVTFYPQGDMDSPQPVSCDVSWADESGDHSVRGDGRSSLNQGRGKRIRRTCIIEAPSDLDINENSKDLFEVEDPAGETVLVSLHRRDGIDEVSQTLVCIASREKYAQPGRREG